LRGYPHVLVAIAQLATLMTSPNLTATIVAMKVLALRIILAAALLTGQWCVTASKSLRQPETATAMAGVEGEACGPDEYKRYKSIVCTVEKTCGCAEAKCELDWCADYVHEWKKEFGACLLKGC